MDDKQKDSIKRIFNILQFCSLTHKQEDLIQSFEDQFNKSGELSPKQYEVLLDIYERADV